MGNSGPVLPLFSQADSGPEPLELGLGCPRYLTRGLCSLPKSSYVSCPSPKILVEKEKWAFSLSKAPSRKHCQDVSGIGLSEISGEVIYLICNYVFISCIMFRGGTLALFLEKRSEVIGEQCYRQDHVRNSDQCQKGDVLMREKGSLAAQVPQRELEAPLNGGQFIL